MNYKHEIAEYVNIALQSPKVAANVGIGTILAATFREFIDGVVAYLGTSAVAITAVLSLVLIYNNIKGGIVKRKLDLEEFKVAKLAQEKLMHELQEMRRKDG